MFQTRFEPRCSYKIVLIKRKECKSNKNLVLYIMTNSPEIAKNVIRKLKSDFWFRSFFYRLLKSLFMYLSKNGPWGSVEAEITPAELLAFYKLHAEV